MYSGKILVAGSNEEALSVPYSGVAFSLLEQIPKMFPVGSPTIGSSGNGGFR